MADTKITALTAISTVDPAVDVLPIVDVSDTTMAASGTTKKITSNQILGAGGTATLASATITGDLTVDTSTLKVDSANNRVGFGTASPAAGATTSTVGTTSVSASDYTGSSTWAARFQAAANNQPSGVLLSGLTSGGNVVPGSLHVEPVAASSRSALIATYAADSAVGYFAINRFSPSAGTTTQHFKIADDGVATWSNVGGVAGTAMTLNSTGLGVGGSPFSKLSIIDTTNNFPGCFRGSGGGNTNFVAIGTTTLGASINGFTAGFAATADLILQPNGGNVGVGVTPSAKLDVYQATLGTAYFRGGYSARQLTLTATSDGVNDGAVHTFLIGSSAGQYKFSNSSGTLMTLDASGNLLVKKTSASGTTLGVELLATGQINGATAGADNLNIYNTTAAAYRFYVSAAGTIFATNTTISAISDARLKENVQDIDVGLGAILALKPRKFDWKEGKGKNIKGDRGFIAQEFETVFPNLIDEWKDNAPEGEAPYKSVRQDLIPVLVKAIQELAAEVNALKNA